MKCGILFSGGKDSNFSLLLAKRKLEVKCLITLNSKNDYSYMFQKVGINFVKIQAKLLNLPLIFVDTCGQKEKELFDLELAIKKAIYKYKIRAIITGAIKSTYQTIRIQEICNRLDIYCFNPLWQIDEEIYLNQLIENKFKILIISIAAYPFTEKYLGRMIDNDFKEDLLKLNYEFQLSLVGEGGEFESFVLDSPLFTKTIKVIDSIKKMDSENSGILEIKKIKLIEK